MGAREKDNVQEEKGREKEKEKEKKGREKDIGTLNKSQLVVLVSFMRPLSPPEAAQHQLERLRTIEDLRAFRVRVVVSTDLV